MSISKPRLIFNVLFIVLFFVLFMATYPASYSSMFLFVSIIGVFTTIGFFINTNTKNKKTKWSIFAISFSILF